VPRRGRRHPPFAAPRRLAAPAALDVPAPGQAVMGIGMIYGWHCTASKVQIFIDDYPALVAPVGSSRMDTTAVCGGNSDSGYGYPFAWDLIGPGQHTIRAVGDGVEFARRTFTVRSQPQLAGRWNGADLERRSGCRAAQNDGNHGTYSQLQIAYESTGFTPGPFSMQQTGVTGLTCNYTGTSNIDALGLNASGTFSCSDGKTGTFKTTEVMVGEREMSMQMQVKLNGSETCSIDKTLGGSRY
jgi:hypothetical protein